MRPIATMLALLFACVGLASSALAEERSERPECPGEKRALVLSGGGVRGAYQVGALWYLVTVARCDFEHFVGTSTGAVTAAVLSEATSFRELKQRVQALVDDYRRLRTEKDVISKYRFRYLRLLLPRWLGGIDGTATLDPIVKQLSTRLSDRPRTNLTIAVVSLQAGKVYYESHRPESLRDFVVGSASIPVAIEPRPARLWVRAMPGHLQGNVLTLRAVVRTGMRDPDCMIKLDEGWIVRCEDLRIKNAQPPELLRLRLPLSEADLDRVAEIIRRTDQTGFELGLPISKMHLAPFEVMTLHQLVDGGVTTHTPLTDALEARPDVDYFFILDTGTSAYGSRDEFRGGIAIGGAALTLLWESYQNSAVQADLLRLNFDNAVCGIIEVLQKLPPDAASFERLELLVPKHLRSPFSSESARQFAKQCESQFRILRIEPVLDPPDMHQIDSLKPHPAKIRNALYSGCIAAGNRLGHALAVGTDEPPFVRSLGGSSLGPEVEIDCNPLKP